MQLSTGVNDTFGCPFSLNETEANPVKTPGEVVNFGHRLPKTPTGSF